MLRHAVVGVGVAVVLIACDPTEDVAVVEMYDDLFEPAQMQVEPGQPIRFENIGRVPHRITWTVAILIVPVVGVLAYLIAGRPRLAWTRRLALIGGGLVGWMVLLIVSVLAAGVL